MALDKRDMIGNVAGDRHRRLIGFHRHRLVFSEIAITNMTDTFDILHKVVREAKCFPNWSFRIVNEDGALRLVIRIDGHNNYDLTPFVVDHYHPVPITTYNEKSWRRWVYEQCRRTMNHEIGEALNFDGVRPFVPMHGPGEDPYTTHEIRLEQDGLMTQSGVLRERPL